MLALVPTGAILVGLLSPTKERTVLTRLIVVVVILLLIILVNGHNYLLRNRCLLGVLLLPLILLSHWYPVHFSRGWPPYPHRLLAIVLLLIEPHHGFLHASLAQLLRAIIDLYVGSFLTLFMIGRVHVKGAWLEVQDWKRAIAFASRLFFIDIEIRLVLV